jgi:iron complex transport system ATP-binding protein
MNAGDPVVRLEQVGVRRGDKLILNNINLEILPNQRWVVIGANGAGKTTLFNLLAANSHPTQGKVTLLGQVLGKSDLFELRPRIGYVTAKLVENFPESERVLDVVLTAAYAITGRWQESYEASDLARAMQLLGAMGVGELSERNFHTLSEGERKRVLIARALMPNPELLLLDEPASALDLAGRELLLAKLTEMANDLYGPTLVIVTHHLEEIPIGTTHALLLSNGNLVAAGPIAQVLTSQLISQAYGMQISVWQDGQRFFARAN